LSNKCQHTPSEQHFERPASFIAFLPVFSSVQIRLCSTEAIQRVTCPAQGPKLTLAKPPKENLALKWFVFKTLTFHSKFVFFFFMRKKNVFWRISMQLNVIQ